MESSSGVFEGLRELISVSENTAGSVYDLETSQLANIAINLTSEPSGVDLGEMEVTLTSQEGLGSFSISHPGFGQTLEMRLTIRLWNIEMNETEEGVRLLLENTSLSESGITVGEVNEVSLTVQRLAQLSGIVF